MKRLQLEIDDGLADELRQLMGLTLLAGERPNVWEVIVRLILWSIDEGKTTLILDPDMQKHLAAGGNHDGGGRH